MLLFDSLKKPIDYTKHNLMYGVTDWGRLNQFNLYESGYSFLYMIDYPEFLKALSTYSDYKDLINNYNHILQFEFKGIDGIENLTVDALEINDGINQMSVIGKVNRQSNSQVSMRYTEKSGSVITRLHELYLTGIKDPGTQIKRYHGAIKADGTGMRPGYENEVFTLLYIVTDNTALNVEKAFLLLNAQPTTAELSIYESEKGSIENKEVTVEMNCFPVTGAVVNEAAAKILQLMNSDNSGTYHLNWNSTTFNYHGMENILGKADITQQDSAGLKTV